MEFRRYRDGDYGAVCDFLSALAESTPAHRNWNWARFEWMAEHPEFDKTKRDTFGLWWDGGRVAGAALYDMYFGEAFCGTLPEHAGLYPEILSYAWDNLRDEAGLGVSVWDGSPEELAALEAAGFVPAMQRETVMVRPLADLPNRPLPEGLTFREMDHERDGRTLEWLAWQGFDHGSDREEFEKTASAKTTNRPHFRRELSLAAFDGTGEGVSCCCLWYREGTDYAYVEPVCTVPAWRGKGAAGALVTLAMGRAAALGAKSAWVISELPFYKHLGFRKKWEYRFYWKR